MADSGRYLFGNGNTLFRCLVRKHGATHKVANGPNPRQSTLALIVDVNESPIIRFQTALRSE